MALITFIALATGSWWFWRNWRLYGDPTALRPMLTLVGLRTEPAAPLGQAWLMFRSFWGQIPCSFYPPPFYLLYAVLALVSVCGLVLVLLRLALAEGVPTLILAGWFLLVTVAWVRWDRTTPAPGGRLLFPALPAVALLMALGVTRLTRGKLRVAYWMIIGLLGLSAVWTVAGILPRFFAPPPRFQDASAIQANRPLNASFGSEIGLLGYDLEHGDEEPALDVRLYWQSQAPMSEDYVLALQLVSPAVGDTALRWNYNTWPGNGNYPTSAWQSGEVILDRYSVRLPEAGFRTQAWDLQAVLYEQEGGARLPVRVQGNDVGDSLMLARVRVPGGVPTCPVEGQLHSEVRFADAVALTHASIHVGPEDVEVVLCWKALDRLQSDYTVFAHLQASDGLVASTGDGPPMNGSFPTSLWVPGDVTLDLHRIPRSSGDQLSGHRILVGLYSPENGSRLPANVDGVSVPHDAVPIWPDRL